jgi:hypothetical protein
MDSAGRPKMSPKKKEKKKNFMFEKFLLGLEASPEARRPFVGGF